MTESEEAEALISEMQELRARARAYLATAPKVRAELAAVMAQMNRAAGGVAARLVWSADQAEKL